jgi:hypothetical protein
MKKWMLRGDEKSSWQMANWRLDAEEFSASLALIEEQSM